MGAFIAGFLGVGGGIVYIPILNYFLERMGLRGEVLVKAILANSLFTIIFSGGIASYKQYKMGNFFPREILYTAIPGVISALAMTYLIENGNWYSKKAFNYVFVVMLFIIIVRMFFARNKGGGEEDEKTIFPYQFSATGFLAGFVTALSGLGGGMVMTPIFTDSLKLNIKKASSISNGVIPLFAISMGIYNVSSNAPFISEWQMGYIAIPLVLPMILATFVFAPIGVKISQSTKPQIIRLVFASFVSIVFIKVLYEILG
jgi:uncharacterized membrane protein YfcA